MCAENAVYSVVEGRRPNATDLAGLSDRPIYITTYDQHSVWLNDAALRVLGIAAGGDIAWGNPERDPSTGEPTGWVTDFYTSAMTPHGLEALQRDIPMYSPQRRYRKLLGSMKMATALGITTVVEPQVPLAEIELFYRARREGRLSSRVIAALFHPVGADGAFRGALREAVDSAPVDPDAAVRAGEALCRRRDRAAHRADAPGLRQPARPAGPGELSQRGTHRGAHRTGPARVPDAHPRDRRRRHPAGPRRDRTCGARATAPAIAGMGSCTSNACTRPTSRASAS